MFSLTVHEILATAAFQVNSTDDFFGLRLSITT